VSRIGTLANLTLTPRVLVEGVEERTAVYGNTGLERPVPGR
jgi:hypothetical protein